MWGGGGGGRGGMWVNIFSSKMRIDGHNMYSEPVGAKMLCIKGHRDYRADLEKLNMWYFCESGSQ